MSCTGPARCKDFIDTLYYIKFNYTSSFKQSSERKMKLFLSYITYNFELFVGAVCRCQRCLWYINASFSRPLGRYLLCVIVEPFKARDTCQKKKE